MNLIGVKFVLGIIAAISGLLVAILLAYFSSNILYFIRTQLSGHTPSGRRPTEKSSVLWVLLGICVVITVCASALVGALPDPPPPLVAATITALEQERRNMAATAAAIGTQQAEYVAVSTQLVNLQATQAATAAAIDTQQAEYVAVSTQLVNLQATSVSQATQIAQYALPTQPLSSLISFENFDANLGFKSTVPQNIYISQEKVFWNVSRSGGDQYLYRTIPTFQGNVRLTVVGQVNDWTNNCASGVGIGDKLGSGIAINFGYYGGGCPTSGAVITATGATLDIQEEQCTFVGDWLWINPKTPTRAELTTKFTLAELSVEGIGKAKGIVNYVGDYKLLWIGMSGNGDWPSCSGEIHSIKIEPLP